MVTSVSGMTGAPSDFERRVVEQKRSGTALLATHAGNLDTHHARIDVRYPIATLVLLTREKA